MLKLFELAAQPSNLRFSPFVWRVKMCLMHKGIEFESEAGTFMKKEAFAESGSATVPVIKNGDTWVNESLQIAKYLEDTFPENPLFEGPQARAQAAFFNSWCDKVVASQIFTMIAGELVQLFDADSAAYFRETREKRLGGNTLEAVMATRDDRLPAFRASLAPARDSLKQNQFLCGDAPAWMDYAFFGTLMWPYIATEYKLIEEDDPIYTWRERMLDLYDGYARSAKTIRDI